MIKAEKLTHKKVTVFVVLITCKKDVDMINLRKNASLQAMAEEARKKANGYKVQLKQLFEHERRLRQEGKHNDISATHFKQTRTMNQMRDWETMADHLERHAKGTK